MRKTIRMKEADLKAWTAWLRANPDKQGAGYLCDASGGYCCLGALQIALGEPDVERTDYLIPPDDAGRRLSRALPSIHWLSERGIQFVEGFDHDDQPVYGCDILYDSDSAAGRSFSGLNDNGTSFAEIADLIEQCAETY